MSGALAGRIQMILFYFSLEQRNVVFPSAMDGWDFGIEHFDKI